MYSLLDGIIDAAEQRANGPRVLGEQHDVSKITFDPTGGPGRTVEEQIAAIEGGSWDQAEYGITKEQAIARIRAADTPEARAKAVEELRARAIQRAGLNVTAGRVSVMTAGALPWHGLGVNVASAVTAAQARDLAGLNFTVSKRPVRFQKANGDGAESRFAWSIVRDDTDEELGSVGARYQPIQNDEATDFLDSVVGEFGASYETAGALYNGSKIWFLIHMPRQTFDVNGGDRQEPYVLFENPHDGTGSAHCYPTVVRVVCANTKRLAEKERYKGLKIRHTGDVRAKVNAARAALGMAVEEFGTYKDQAESLYRKPLEIKPYANDVLDAVLEVTAAQAKMGADVLAASLAVTQANRDLEAKRLQRQIDKRGEVLADIIERYESERCGVGSIRGTAWAAYNAITEHADHTAPSRKQSASARFESLLTGPADELKQVAFELALKA